MHQKLSKDKSRESVREEDDNPPKFSLTPPPSILPSSTGHSTPAHRYNRSFSYNPTHSPSFSNLLQQNSSGRNNRTRSTSYTFSFHPNHSPSSNSFSFHKGSTHSLTYNPSHSPSHNSLAQSLAQNLGHSVSLHGSQSHIQKGCPVHDPPRTRSSSTSSSSRSVESQLINCGICGQRFNNPKVSNKRVNSFFC